MILLGDCIERLKELEDNSVDSVVTDPPYGLKFMGKKWDYDVPSKEVWLEVFRVIKPGGHLLSFGGTRTYHHLAMAIDLAGFEIRDQLQWLYGSGFPKSLSIDKAIDKLLGAKREVIATKDVGPDMRGGNFENAEGRMIAEITKPSTPEACRYKGWGTALKPANEPIVLARKPLEKGLTVAQNMLKWGVGGLNIDESRIGVSESDPNIRINETKGRGYQAEYVGGKVETVDNSHHGPPAQGRWPANLLLDETAAQMLDEQSGTLKSGAGNKNKSNKDNGKTLGSGLGKGIGDGIGGDSGGASRFFYVAKASKRERNAGLEGMPERNASKLDGGAYVRSGGVAHEGLDSTQIKSANHHPTVKPIKLMEYLCKLITPHGGTILDPFCGSGSTGVAAFKNGFKFIGIEMNEEYAKIAEKRIAHASSDE